MDEDARFIFWKRTVSAAIGLVIVLGVVGVGYGYYANNSARVDDSLSPDTQAAAQNTPTTQETLKTLTPPPTPTQTAAAATTTTQTRTVTSQEQTNVNASLTPPPNAKPQPVDQATLNSLTPPKN